MTEDRIERDVFIEAPVSRVWAVLTQGEHVGQWFGQCKPIEVDLRPGGIMKLDHGKHGEFLTKIVTVDEPRHFSYRWAGPYPGVEATEDNSTLVEFTLAEEGDGTRLRVTERGFATLAIPPGVEFGYQANSKGWTEVVETLRNYTEKLPL